MRQQLNVKNSEKLIELDLTGKNKTPEVSGLAVDPSMLILEQ